MTTPARVNLVLPAVFALLVGSAAAQQGDDSSLPKGFLSGMKGFEKFHEPIGQPLYFESPFNESNVRALFLRHEFSDQSTLAGGDVTIYAVQARLALTERLTFIATKDGYSDLDSGIIQDEGWNDIGFGLKYMFYSNVEQQSVVSGGLRYTAENGTRGILQGGVDEFSPFVSVAKAYDNLHVIGGACLRVPTDTNDGNVVGHWDVHVDYSINPEDDYVFAPTVELHGVHYLDDGASPLNVGGLDYANLGSQPAENFVAWAGIGGRLEFGRFEFGAVYEFALTDPDDDIMDQRITVDFIVRW